MIEIRSETELAILRQAGAIVREALDEAAKIVGPGVSTKDLETLSENTIALRGGRPAFKGYKGYPASICTSINECVVHGMPSIEAVLKDGDIVGIDIGVYFNGYYADAAETFPVGNVAPEIGRLIFVTREALNAAIRKAVPGNRVSDIAIAIQGLVERNGFSVVRDFVGHGIGRKIHEEPEVPNFGEPGKGPRLEKGMVLAIEPMVNAGTHEIEILKDGWTAVTKDRSYSAHFEHTVVVGDTPEVLTK